MASWAYQVATVEEHDDAVIVDAHDAEVLILLRTIILRFADICAGCNLQQHNVSPLHALMSDLKLCTRAHVRPTSWQCAAGSISKRAVVPACARLMSLSANYWGVPLERLYRVLLGGGAACFGLQQEIFEQRHVIHVLLGRSHSCEIQGF